MNTSQKKSKADANIVNEHIVYIGPTIPGVAISGEVYTNGIPQALKEAAETKPLLNKLIVKLSDLPKANKSIVQKSGAYYAAYKSV